MMKWILILLAWLLCAASLLAQANGGSTASTGSKTTGTKTGGVSIQIKGLENDKGRVQLYLFRSPEGWPQDATKASRKVHAPIAANQAKVELKDLPPGKYAAAVLHDEDMDGTMTFNFFGIPQEGWGFTGVKGGTMRKPKFDECIFEVKPGGAVAIEMTYF